MIVVVETGDDFQTKINDAGQNGTVLVSPGTHIVNSELTLENYQTIVGVGEGTVLKLSDSSSHSIFGGTGRHHLDVRNLTVDMNDSGGASGRVFDATDVYQVNVENVRVENGGVGAMYFDSGPQTIPPSGGNYGEGVTIRDCSFEGISSVCINLRNDNEYCAIADCEFQDCGRAIRVNGANHRITGNKITYCNDGIVVLQSVSNEGKHLISDNQINHVLDNPAIKLVDVSNVTIQSNKLLANKQECIDMAGAVNCEIRDNNTKTTVSGFSAMNIRDATNSARGNQIIDNFDRSTSDADFAIREDGGVSGNHFRDNKASIISNPWSLNSADVDGHVPTAPSDLSIINGSEIGTTRVHDGSGRMPEVKCRWDGDSWRPQESVSFLYGGTGGTKTLVSSFQFEQVVVQSGDGAVADAYEGNDISNGALSANTFAGELTVESNGGITVGDGGSDSDPNTDGESYNVFAT
jgi:hypothetical protein